jgi:aspartate racemase
VTAAEKTILGVVGGVGPLASAAFLQTIYDVSIGSAEQDAPEVILFSEPSFPDRTTVLMAGTEQELLDRLGTTCDRLAGLGVSEIVLCCITIHLLLGRLREDQRRRIVSLIDTVVEELEENPDRRPLLLCSIAARELGVFERHPRWPGVADRVVLLRPEDQQLVHHELIYRLKKGVDPAERVGVLRDLLDRYPVDSFISGCTEFHLVARLMAADPGALPGYGFVDPLWTIAHRWAKRHRLAEAA